MVAVVQDSHAMAVGASATGIFSNIEVQAANINSNRTDIVVQTTTGFITMIHKLYVERLQSYFLHRFDGSNQPQQCQEPQVNRLIDGNTIDACSSNGQKSRMMTFQIISIPKVTGVSQSRRGYALLQIQCHDHSIEQSIQWYALSPMLRQNISWIAPIQYNMKEISLLQLSQHQQIQQPQQEPKSVGCIIWNTIQNQMVEGPAISLTKEGNDQQQQVQADMFLRVDCYPKQYLEAICIQLQRACQMSLQTARTSTAGNTFNSNTTEDNVIIDPFDGPIPMTMSKTKCTHKLSIVVVDTSDPVGTATSITGTNTHDVYWGIERRSHSKFKSRMIMDVPLNHEAANEIVIVPIEQQKQNNSNSNCNNKRKQQQQPDDEGTVQFDKFVTETSLSLSTSSTVPVIPVSRAYYKLYEIWHDYILPNETDIIQRIFNTRNAYDTGAATVSAIDIGAAPGGWTQVLFHHMNVQSVIAIDRAQLAPNNRLMNVATLPQQQHVFQIPTLFENVNLQEQYSQYCQHRDDQQLTKPPPFPTKASLLVCDASVQWNVLLPMFIRTLQQQYNMNVIQWTVPCIVIITLKLPFKTLHSIQRHLTDIQDIQVPGFIIQLQSILYPSKNETAGNRSSNRSINVRHRIIHCMANSDSERTLLILFD